MSTAIEQPQAAAPPILLTHAEITELQQMFGNIVLNPNYSNTGYLKTHTLISGRLVRVDSEVQPAVVYSVHGATPAQKRARLEEKAAADVIQTELDKLTQ